jgi:hypothetical protein
MGSLADALAGAAAKRGITVDQIVLDEVAQLVLDGDVSHLELPLAKRPPGAITRRIEVPPLSNRDNPRQHEVCLVQPKFVQLSFLGAERHRAELELPPDQARYIAYLLVQGADLLDGEVVAVDEKGYDVLVDAL